MRRGDVAMKAIMWRIAVIERVGMPLLERSVHILSGS
jgi:hypothetical protein